MFCYHVSLWRVDGKYTLSGEILAQMAQNENFVRQSNKNMRQKYQKAQKSTLRQIKSAPKFLHLRYNTYQRLIERVSKITGGEQNIVKKSLSFDQNQNKVVA